MMDEFLWPARTVAEYAYCPRLFYYIQVEGVFLPSEDTELGNAAHRRVNRPSRSKKADKADEDDGEDAAVEEPDRPRSVRSLALSSQQLGLTATLDLAELDGKTAIPVETRKGSPRRVALDPPLQDPDEAGKPSLARVEPWPTDRVQVGLQVLLLEEAGYQVPKAVLYYVKERRRVEVPVDQTLRDEALAVLGEARRAAEDPRPAPLVHDARCLRCSLQPICLPDELVHQVAGESGSEELTPRKLWPPRDDAIHVVAQTQGAKIGISGYALKLTDREGKTLREIPLSNVDSLALLGGVQISTQALQALASDGIPVGFMSAAGRMVAMVDPLDSVSAKTRVAQVRGFDDPQRCLELARALIAAKIVNQRVLLTRNHPALPEETARGMQEMAERAAKAISLESLRGVEGQAAALYFGEFGSLFKGEEGREFQTTGRRRRPPPDPVNACLSFAYAMLTHECTSALRMARLEPSIGAFHVSRPGRPALALDLMEPFRPLISDSIAVSAFNRGELKAGHFHRTAAGCAFSDAGRKAFFQAYGRRMDAEVTHPVFEYRLSYRRMLSLHALLISAWLQGEVPSLSFLTTR